MKLAKWFEFGSALSLAVLLMIPFAGAQPHPSAPVIVTRYCSGCHGLDGKSQLPYIPRLAGQDADYLQSKLTSFRGMAQPPVDEALDRVVHAGSAHKNGAFTTVATMHMVGVANGITPDQIKAAAQWYAAQAPAQVRSGKDPVNEEGRNLFAEGLQSQGLAACQSCHGTEAQGTHTAPRLAGQSAAYLMDQLAFYRSSEVSSSPMVEIARRVRSDQARAVAEYLQSR